MGTAAVEESDGGQGVSFMDASQIVLHVQVWGDCEGSWECLLDLPVIFANPGPAAERRLLANVAQIAAREAQEFAEAIGRRAADLYLSTEVGR